MPCAYKIEYVCPECLKKFWSTHYKQPKRCAECRKKHRAAASLRNYHKRRDSGREQSKRRDPAYDGVQHGAPPSVYASTCVIHLRYERATCEGCKQVRDLINGYCEVCRANCANEHQCKNATKIRYSPH